MGPLKTKEFSSSPRCDYSRGRVYYSNKVTCNTAGIDPEYPHPSFLQVIRLDPLGVREYPSTESGKQGNIPVVAMRYEGVPYLRGVMVWISM